MSAKGLGGGCLGLVKAADRLGKGIAVAVVNLGFVQKLGVRHVSNSPIQRVRHSPISLRR